MLVAVVCREKKEVSNEIALFYIACGFIDGSASGCSNRATATISPGTDLNRLKTFYLVHPPKDTHNIHNLSRDKLTKDGFTATAGPELPQSSNQADSIITYVDRWMWDITLYLLDLTVTSRFGYGRIQERLLGESRSSPRLTDQMCSSQPKAPQRTT